MASGNDGPACDFCMGHYPRWEYPCDDHHQVVVLGGDLPTSVESEGSWLACEPCAEQIEGGNVDGLMLHTLHHLLPRHPGLPRKVAATLVIDAQDLFRHHRQGDRVAWG